MTDEERIERSRKIFWDVIDTYEDSEWDDPEYLTGEVVDFVNFRECEDTLLHKAMWRKENEGAKLLVELGIDINALGDMSDTALHVAARKGNIEMYDYLISKGAKDDIVNEFGNTPKQYLEKYLEKNTAKA